ncbi:MAG TPA: hypothetical protein VFE46_10725 [Pirellulales bacterium]|jgi:hypothetical protein|nr:hypothetical protein [Pirellulales bacterium]
MSMNTRYNTAIYSNPLFKLILVAASAAALSVALELSPLCTKAANELELNTIVPSQASGNVAIPESQSKITEAEVNAAQQAWCDALVNIGKVYAAGGDYRAAANQAITDLYDYDSGRVFFKPTLAHGANTFRPTKAGALSYFVGGNPAFPEDTGFALKRWTKVSYDNNAAENGIQIHGDIAITMGNVYLTNADGEQVTVDKTFVFRRCPDGKLRLIVHKSSLPYDPTK